MPLSARPSSAFPGLCRHIHVHVQSSLTTTRSWRGVSNGRTPSAVVGSSPQPGHASLELELARSEASGGADTEEAELVTNAGAALVPGATLSRDGLWGITMAGAAEMFITLRPLGFFGDVGFFGDAFSATRCAAFSATRCAAYLPFLRSLASRISSFGPSLRWACASVRARGCQSDRAIDAARGVGSRGGGVPCRRT